jgi:hypothetical protein
MQDFTNFLQQGALVPWVPFLTFPSSFIFCPLGAMILNILAWNFIIPHCTLVQQYLLHKLNIDFTAVRRINLHNHLIPELNNVEF